MRTTLWLAAAGLMATLAGCGQGEAAKIVNNVVPVAGKIVLADGRPAANLWVTFNAKDPPGNDANAATEADGSFKLGTFAKADGAIPGNYVVTLGPNPAVKGGAPSIPSAYTSATNSPLKIEIKSSGSEQLPTITLK